MNVDLLAQILTTEHEYWIFQQSSKGSMGDVFTEIFFGSIPPDIERFEKRGQITLAEIDKLSRAHIVNVFLSSPFAPFQNCVSLTDVVMGFPVTGDKREFLKKAMEFQSKDIFEYKKLIVSDTEKTE